MYFICVHGYLTVLCPQSCDVTVIAATLLEELPFEDNVFDMVLFNQVGHPVDKPGMEFQPLAPPCGSNCGSFWRINPFKDKM